MADMKMQGMVEGMPGWEYVRLIGSGSFGSVYEVKKVGFENVPHSALKVITIPRDRSELSAIHYLNEDGTRKYFESYKNEVVSEIEMMSRFKGHSHIVSLEDYTEIEHTDEIGWDILMRMELLETVDQAIAQKTFTDEELSEFVIKLGMDVCEALMLCHGKNIIHRDVKPANIFINRNGDFKLGDFGIAKTMERTLSVMSQKGSPAYMAPEVFNGKGYDQSCDIYSLGMTLYRYLNSYRLPFEPMEDLRPSDVEMAQTKRLRGERIKESLHGTSRLKEVVLKAVEYKPDNRYRSAEEFYDALNECRKDTSGPPIHHPQQFPYKLIYSVLIVLILALIGAIAMKISNDKETEFYSKSLTAETDTLSVTEVELDTELDTRMPEEYIYKQPETSEPVYWVKGDNTLKSDCGYFNSGGNESETVDTVFGNEEWHRKDIRKIFFLNSFKDVPDDAIDLSANLDRSIAGWLEDSTLYIAGEGGVKAPSDCNGLFACYENLEELIFGDYFDTSEVTDMNHMFYHCRKVKKLDLGCFDTSRVTNMSSMFISCMKLSDINLSSFDTSNVKTFKAMFNECNNLKVLDIRSFDTSNAESMQMMFRTCRNLKEIMWDPDIFQTKNVTNMHQMFVSCESIEYIDISKFDFSNAEDIGSMFYNCKSLKELRMPDDFNINHIDKHNKIFKNSSLESLYGADGEEL